MNEPDEVHEHEKRTTRDKINATAGVREEAPPSAVANFNLFSLLLIGLRRAQMEPLRIGSRVYFTVPPRHRGETNDNANNRLLAKDEHTENSTFCSFNFVEG